MRISCVIDISHHNGAALDFVAARNDGIVGVIHKASQGTTGRDPMYKINRKKACDAGLLWGAYHFATGSEAVQQAVNFLDAVGDPEGVLMVLDLEPNPSGPSMDLAGARAFVIHVREKTGRWPGLYSGHTIKDLLGNKKDPVLANCWLWLAQYGPKAVVPPNTGSFFGLYFMMTGIHGIHVIVGIGVMIWIYLRNQRGDFSKEFFTPVDIVALYWHLVDLVWIYLFPLLYLV